MPVKEKTGKCKGFAFELVPGHVQKEILKWNGITLENWIIDMEDGTSTKKKEIKKICKKLVVTSKHPEIKMYSAP